jgi:type IX secretion system PorP/SprF family membrane protein
MYANDEAGTHKLGSKLTALSGAFHYSLDKKFRNVLTLGLQMGVGSRGLTIAEANSFYTELKTGVNDPTARGTLDKSASYVDFNAGLLFKSTIDKTSNFSAGFSLAHLAKAKYSLLKSKPANVKIPLYVAGTIAYNRKINSKVSIHPSILVHNQTAAFTANPQMMVGYRMTQKGTAEPMTLKAGLGYRANGNAANVLLGVEVKDIKVGVGYDLNTGALKNSVNDAIEIAIQYTGKIYKKPTVKPVMVCPKY